MNSRTLAEELANPLTVLISVPFFGNYNGDVGPDREGSQWFMNIQPVVPIELNPDWHVISRTILPVMFSQSDIFPGSGSQSGLRDTTEGLYFSPSQTFEWLHRRIGADLSVADRNRRAAGRREVGRGSYRGSCLAGQRLDSRHSCQPLWSFAGDADRTDFNQSYLQPFIAYTTPKAWTFTLQGEDTYDWETGEWSAPIDFLVAKIVKIQGQPVSIVGRVRYWIRDSPDTGPHGFGGQLGMTFLFPKQSIKRYQNPRMGRTG